VSEPSPATIKRIKRWLFPICLATSQNAVAVFAVYASSRDILSDGACIGGVFGTLVNLAIFAVVLVWGIILVVKSLKKRNWHTSLKPLFVVGLSSAIAILIGQHAALRCTV
jgi:hypothetical protein